MSDPTVIWERDGRIARITLNRPDVLNAIDDDMPRRTGRGRVEQANDDDGVHVIVLSGAGKAFCAGYDLAYYAEATGGRATRHAGHALGPDEGLQVHDAQHRAASCRCGARYKPVIAKVHGFAVAGGSDIALCCDLVVMAEDAEIGYMPARVWGCPTTAMWVYRLGAEKAKRMLFTGDKIDGREAEAHRPRPQSGAGRRARRRGRQRWPSASPACRTTS